MNRLLWTVLLITFVSANAFAQIGVRTAKTGSTATAQSPTESPTPQATPTAPEGETITLERADIDQGEESDTCEVPTGWWPTRNNANNTLCLFNHENDEQEYVKYARFFRTSKTMSATTDLVNDALGGFYMSFSAAVASNTTDDEEDGEDQAQADEAGEDTSAEEDKTVNLLKANGGNLALTASLPIYFMPFHEPNADGDQGRGSLLWNSYVRVAANLDAMGGDTNESTVAEDEINGNVEIAFTEVQVDLLSFARKFNLLGYLKTSAIAGTDKFAEALGDDVGRTFLHGQLGAGIRIADNMSIFFTYNWYSDDNVPGNGGAFTFVLGD